MAQQYERPPMIRASIDGDWFDTGDLAIIDAKGHLRISGRTKDVIIRGGKMRRFLPGKGVARQYWPERLEVIGELPAIASGKIQKFRLREIVRDQAAGSPA